MGNIKVAQNNKHITETISNDGISIGHILSINSLFNFVKISKDTKSSLYTLLSHTL